MLVLSRRAALKVPVIGLSLIGSPAEAENEWGRFAQGALNAVSSQQPYAFQNVVFQPGYYYRLRISGKWKIYGDRDESCGAAGCDPNRKAANDWPAPGAPQACLLIFVGQKVWTMSESNRVADNSAMAGVMSGGKETPPIYEGFWDGNVDSGQVSFQCNDNNYADNRDALFAIALERRKFN